MSTKYLSTIYQTRPSDQCSSTVDPTQLKANRTSLRPPTAIGYTNTRSQLSILLIRKRISPHTIDSKANEQKQHVPNLKLVSPLLQPASPSLTTNSLNSRCSNLTTFPHDSHAGISCFSSSSGRTQCSNRRFPNGWQNGSSRCRQSQLTQRTRILTSSLGHGSHSPKGRQSSPSAGWGMYPGLPMRRPSDAAAK